MMGSTHCLTSALAAVSVAPLLGLGPGQTLASAVVAAGAGLIPDLDHHNSCATLAHGPVTKIFSSDLRQLSQFAYRMTSTTWDDKSAAYSHDAKGTHRYLTHTGSFAVALGLIIGLASGWTPFRLAIVMLMISFAIRGVCQFKPNKKLDHWVVRTVIGAAGAYLVPMDHWTLGILITLGCLTHDLGDWMTKAGVPIFWPLKIRGMYWRRYRFVITSSTGHGHLEPILRWSSVVGAPIVFMIYR